MLVLRVSARHLSTYDGYRTYFAPLGAGKSKQGQGFDNPHGDDKL